MKIASGRVLDRLPQEEACFGAIFMAYGFDPGFFEDHVLRAVLRLTSDPVEQMGRYLGEARRALQETPVAVVVDAGERQPGRRLPYDLLEVSDLVFHPKSALVLYEERAVLMVGSGNLTFSGYGGNTELFITLNLKYDEPADCDLLRTFDDHLGRISDLTRQNGTQLSLFRQELTRRMNAQTGRTSSSVTLLDSTTGPIIAQLAALLPEGAAVDYVGMLAPFYERDDDGELDVTSVFGALLPRTTASAVLDVGVAWENAQVRPDASTVKLEDGLGALWAWSYEKDAERVIDYLVPTKIGTNVLSYTDQRGNSRRCEMNEAVAAVAERSLWKLPQPIVYAPQKTLSAAKSQFADVRLWLHPAMRLLEGLPVHRPLHAKMLMVGFSFGRTPRTLVLIGSANMSRRAILLKAGRQQGNVELGVAFALNGAFTLADFVPELVSAPADALELREKEFPEPDYNYALAIEEATHDPAERILTVLWAQDGRELRDWKLTYCGNELTHSSGVPAEPLVFKEFILQSASAEIVLHVEGGEYPVPILVTDLVALPITSVGKGFTLDELLMLLGRRIGTERAAQIAERRAANGEGIDVLSAFFGEGFGPTDVFKAWWAVAEDLRDPTLSVPAFRLRIAGAIGVGEAWNRMHEAIAEGLLQPTEVWFYGAELLRSLGEIELTPTSDRAAKEIILTSFRKRVTFDLANIELDEDGRPWVEKVRSHYTEARP